jgi:hypothetical protein
MIIEKKLAVKQFPKKGDIGWKFNFGLKKEGRWFNWTKEDTR